jgi:hypothetical protein
MTKLFSEVFDLKPTRGMTREELARLLAQGAAVSNCRLKSKSAAESRRIKGSAVWKQPLLGAVARVRRIKFRTPKIRHICHGFDLYKTVSVREKLSQRPVARSRRFGEDPSTGARDDQIAGCGRSPGIESHRWLILAFFGVFGGHEFYPE